ncbi:MAG: pyrimidine 5'-nucleotidase [Rhodospirillales bacterium]|nr:pyrimidine 5'-nucleotidase [Rhodospirillales bacterium]MCW8862536.1 pyrimidine 5'-nucleotidase [Rhodospirillales bacterium]
MHNPQMGGKENSGGTDHPLDLIETWIFDLDNTLYPASSNLFAQVDTRIRDYIAGFLDLPADEAYTLQKRYFREHGTTLRGLMSLHDVDPVAYMDYVHDIDLAPIAADPALDAALSRLPGRKAIFTNASTKHAARVMDRLGVTRHFDVVFDIADAGYLPKPETQGYEILIGRLGADPSRTVMVEDIARNLKPAADMGMTTVWVRTDSIWGKEGSDAPHVHHVTDDLSAWITAIT